MLASLKKKKMISISRASKTSISQFPSSRGPFRRLRRSVLHYQMITFGKFYRFFALGANQIAMHVQCMFNEESVDTLQAHLQGPRLMLRTSHAALLAKAAMPPRPLRAATRHFL
ncbi:uncharacterized protein LOC114274479 isoform X6 [Camellia sinensis]|uniref:uncharacterized protein LOC114274479 isoform X6 n=1 Tax=Camellia sinensis TaxID=4442 RepID=UPI00103616E5|nr:uncharacterized protein LOC114274479 isoform X6 [Camellia sinensis]XP_028072212.1 uncharacterized protein LOC114274479 isoform X6 [Camellia sinensis]